MTWYKENWHVVVEFNDGLLPKYDYSFSTHWNRWSAERAAKRLQRALTPENRSIVHVWRVDD